MRLITTERYVPDVDDNRARAARGDRHWSVDLTPPSARVWMRFALACGDTPLERPAEILLHDAAAEALWLPCIGQVHNFPDIGVPVPDGAALWALRDRLDTPHLFLDLIRAVSMRAHLEAGLAGPLVSRPASSDSPLPVPMPAGTAASADGAA